MARTRRMLGLACLGLKSRSTSHVVVDSNLYPRTYCRFVETKYNLEIGAAQISQLSKALGSGSEKGIFVLPKGLTFLMFKPPPTHLKTFHKGPSGRVKLAPKNKHVEPESSDEVGDA